MLSQHACITRNDAVLDAGCGVGGSSVWLAKNIGCQVTGISLNAMQIKKARAFASREGVSSLTHFHQADYTGTAFPDESFDVIWAIESVCYAADKSEFTTEASRLLRKGGRLIIADFFKRDKMNIKEAAQVRKWAHGWAIEDYATAEGFKEALKQTGFTDIWYKNVNEAVMPSAKRLYRAYFLGFIPAYLYRLFNPEATDLAKNNVDTAYLQYVTLKKNLWFYGIMYARKL